MSKDIQQNVEDLVVWCPTCKKRHKWNQCEFKGKCLTCKIRPATLHFGDMLSFTHGGGLNCCEICCARMQLEHAEERAAAIDGLRAKLKELEEQENPPA